MRSYINGFNYGPYGNTLYGAPRSHGHRHHHDDEIVSTRRHGHRQGRLHARMAQRRLRKSTENAVGGLGMGMGLGRMGIAAPLGLIGLIGAGIIGYSLLKKRSIGGVSTVKTSSWRSWLPFKSSLRGFITPASISSKFSTPIGTTAPLATGIAKAPIVHNRKVPLKERALAKVTRRPVITNYH